MKVEDIENNISKLEAAENRESIIENFKKFSQNPEKINLQEMWKVLNKIGPKFKSSVPTAKFNHKRKLISNPDELKKLLAKEYRQRLRPRPIRPDRSQLINQNRRKKKKDDKVRCIFTYNEGNPPLHQWLRQAKKCLVKNEKAKHIGEKMQITFRQPKNLKKLVTGLPKMGEGEMEINPGCYKCAKKCHTCKILKEGKHFWSTNTGRKYKI